MTIIVQLLRGSSCYKPACHLYNLETACFPPTRERCHSTGSLILSPLLASGVRLMLVLRLMFRPSSVIVSELSRTKSGYRISHRTPLDPEWGVWHPYGIHPDKGAVIYGMITLPHWYALLAHLNVSVMFLFVKLLNWYHAMPYISVLQSDFRFNIPRNMAHSFGLTLSNRVFEYGHLWISDGAWAEQYIV